MPATSTVVYGVAVLTALFLGLFVFLLIPRRRVDASATVEVHSSLGVVQQRTTGATIAAAVPQGYAGWLEKQIVLAGRPPGWSVARLLTWKVVLATAGGALGMLFVFAGGPQPLKVLLSVVAVVLLFFLPDVLINSRAHDRQQAIQLALPDNLDQMTIAVEAGLGFDAAMAKAAQHSSGPLSEELIRVLQDMSIGRTRRDAFHELERRTNSVDLRRFGRAIIQADAYGIAVGDVLRVQAAEMRLKRRQRAEEQAMKVTVKIVFPLVVCLLPALLIVVMTPGVLNAIAALS